MSVKVLTRLKPKVASLGFTTKELEGAATAIASNLENSEDASDEIIDAAVDAVLPYLKLGQAQATRIINENKRTLPKPQSTRATDGAVTTADPPKQGADSQNDIQKQITAAVTAVLNPVLEKLNGSEVTGNLTLIAAIGSIESTRQ